MRAAVPRDWHFCVHERKLAVREWGDPQGVPVIALHGWLDNAASFTLLAHYLPQIRIIALDMAGHGWSDHRPLGQPYYIWDNVADVHALMDTLGLEQAVLLGHSMGAAVATLFAGAFPERVSQMIMLDGLVPLDYSADDLPASLAKAVRKAARLGRRSLRPYESFEQAIATRMNSRWPVSKAAATWLLERGLKETASGWYWRSDLALTQPSIVRLCEAQIAAFVRSLTMPVLLVMADKGKEFEPIEATVNLVTDLDFKIVEAHHHLHLEEPAARQIAEWISQRL